MLFTTHGRRASGWPGSRAKVARLQVEGLESRTVLSAARQYVAGLYEGLLHRAADDAGLDGWTAYLNQGGSRDGVALGILRGIEYRTNLVEDWYQNLLEREADAGGLAGWLQILQHGGSAEDVQGGILGSAEYYQNRGNGNDPGFLQALYQDLLQRDLDDVGRRGWGEALGNGAGLGDVVAGVLHSLEADHRLVTGYYSKFLGRTVDEAGFRDWVGALQAGAEADQVLSQIAGSDESFAHHTTPMEADAGDGGSSLAFGLLPGSGGGPPGGARILVGFRDGSSRAARASVRDWVAGNLTDEVGGWGSAVEVVTLPGRGSVTSTLAALQNHPAVAYAEPDYWVANAAVSNDPRYTNGSLWGMYSNDSPTAAGPSGTTNPYGSRAEQAWAAGHVGSDAVYVGIIDEGIQYTHPDLNDNVWVNPYDPVDGVDNDRNGYVDDVRGWDFVNNNNSIYDGGTGGSQDDHGTHVAGTIGAEGGNATGVAGVNWNVTMISGKFLGPSGGSTSNAVRAINYFVDLKTRHGLNVVALNNSWGGGGYSTSLHNAILRAAKANILFVAAAGNSSRNNDAVASYPANYSSLVGTSTESAATYESVIAVASITRTGTLSSFSSYGATKVDLGAPGSSVVSTVPNNKYASYSGTSMATPHVTGAAALYASTHPGATAAQIRSAILGSVIATPSLAGKTATGGRLNVSGF